MEKTERRVGTVSRGIRCPIIRQGDDLADIVTTSVLEAASAEGFSLRDRDVVCVTESVVARSQGNYATVGAIAKDVRAKTGGGTVGVIFPILSRNRFAICLRGIAAGCKKVVLMLSYPSDEVGNALVSIDRVDEAGINPYSDVLRLERYRSLFGYGVHEFTGVDYVAYYADLIRECGAEVEILFANRARTILDYTDTVITCDIHTRARTKRILREAGARVVLGLDDILNAPVDGSGCNEKYGLLGSNKATEDTVKLFPRLCTEVATELSERLSAQRGEIIVRQILELQLVGRAPQPLGERRRHHRVRQLPDLALRILEGAVTVHHHLHMLARCGKQPRLDLLHQALAVPRE